jgi:UDP-glucose 4-epimerase
MKILVIGSDSFIAQKFIAANTQHNILGISRTCLKSKNEILLSDLREISTNYFLETDVVINFAAIVHRPDIKNEKIFDDVNYKLAIFNAQKAKQAGVNLFIQMSTIAVYGNQSQISISSSCNPRTPYGISKLKADEELLKMQNNNFNTVIIRPPMVYGGGNSPGNMLKLIKLVDSGIPLPFKGVNNHRDFINVHNLVQYLYIIIEKKLNGVYLISDNEPISTEQIIKTISKHLSKPIRIFKFPLWAITILKSIRPHEYDKLFGILDIKTNFPYEELINRENVEQGIQESVEWYRKFN